MNRNNKITIRLNDEELESINQKTKKTGLSREQFIRAVLSGYQLKELPTCEFFEVIRLLRICGENINQVAKKANMTGAIDRGMYEENFKYIQDTISNLFNQFT